MRVSGDQYERKSIGRHTHQTEGTVVYSKDYGWCIEHISDWLDAGELRDLADLIDKMNKESGWNGTPGEPR